MVIPSMTLFKAVLDAEIALTVLQAIAQQTAGLDESTALGI